MVMTIITDVKKEGSKIVAFKVRRYDERKKHLVTLKQIYEFQIRCMSDIKKGFLSKDEKPIYCLPTKDGKEEGYFVISVDKMGAEYKLHRVTERIESALERLPRF